MLSVETVAGTELVSFEGPALSLRLGLFRTMFGILLTMWKGWKQKYAEVKCVLSGTKIRATLEVDGVSFNVYFVSALSPKIIYTWTQICVLKYINLQC
jgi:hypothetical protein